MKYQSWNVRQRKDRKGKSWQARLKYKDPQGKWQEKTRMLKDCSGIKDARKKAQAWFDEMNEAAELAPNIDKDLTVSEVVRKYMDYQLQSGELEQSTYHNRVYVFTGLVDPYIGEITFVSLDRTEIMNWLAKLNAKGLSQGTIGTAFYTVRKTYNYYYELGELLRNPFVGVKPPKKPDAKVTHLTKEQMQYFLDCLENETPRFKLACYLAFYAGLRRGEICGLRWRDIDLDLGIISINSAIGIADGTSYTKQPKNKSSIRTFPIVPQLLEELKKHEDEPNFFVVGNRLKHLYPSTLSTEFKFFVRTYNIVDAYGKPITLHSLRHNLGTVGITSGMDIASLSKMMGHSSRAMTLDTYGDASKDAMVVATDKLGKEFGE